jgi:hypothetical protein
VEKKRKKKLKENEEKDIILLKRNLSGENKRYEKNKGLNYLPEKERKMEIKKKL